MRTAKEIRKRIENLEKASAAEGPYTEQKNIARKAAKQALEWVLEEENTLLTY